MWIDGHYLSEKDQENKTAWCSACEDWVDIIGNEGKKQRCGVLRREEARLRREVKRDQINAVHSAWRENNSEHLKDQHYRRTFGIPFEEVREKFSEQGGVCSICSKTISLTRGALKSIRASLDHNHATGVIRDLLCHHCNTGLGAFQDSPEMLDAAAEYLRRHRG